MLNSRFKNIAVISLLAVLLTGCTPADIPLVGRFWPGGSESGGEQTPVVLEYWGMFEPKEVMDVLISKYQEDHSNVTINYVEKRFEENLSQYKRSLLTRLKQGNAPAMFRIHSTWVPEYLSEIAVNTSSSVITKEEISQKFYPVMVDQCTTSSGQVLCIPLMYDGLALFYNKSMFENAGVTPAASWDELRDVAIRLTQKDVKGEIIRAGVALGTSDNIAGASDILGLMMAQSSVEVPTGLDTEAALAALTFYTNFAKVDKVWDSHMPYSIVAFASQKVAMIFGRSWQILDILELNPTLDFGVVPVPQLPNIDGTTTSETWGSFWVESVSADVNEQEQKEAWKFLKWLSEPEQQLQLFSESSKYRPFGEIYSDKSLKENLRASDFLYPVVQQAPNAKTSIISDLSGNDEYVEVMRTAIEAVLLDRSGQTSLQVLQTAKQNFLNLQSRGQQ